MLYWNRWIHLSFCLFCGLILGFIPASPVAAQEFHYVPDDFASLSAAIAGAVAGDVIIVRNGVYSGDANTGLDPQGKALVIQSENGPGSCFIECGTTRQAFILQSGETNLTIIRGFTIQHGFAADFGGAIACLHASPVIDDCHFENNQALYGGAIAAINAAPRINNCHFFNNRASAFGAGVFLANAEAVISQCIFGWNFAEAGGGLYCCWFSQPHLINSLIIWNSASRGGGIAAEYMGFPDLLNCTLAYNSGGGIQCDWSNCRITNSIVVRNSPVNIETGDSTADVSTSCVEGGYVGAGIIDADPRFAVGPQGEYYLGDGGLLTPNPCVDAGDRPAEEVCWTVTGDMVCLDEYTTSPDSTTDQGLVDIGYHSVDDTTCLRFGTRFDGPERAPQPGDAAGLDVVICNPGAVTHMNLNLFVIMENAGEYWFWPAWSGSDWLPVDLVPGITTWEVFDAVPWGSEPPEWFGNRLYAALTDPAITEIRGEIALYPYRFDMPE